MNLKSLICNLLPPILVPAAWVTPYESANSSSRRGDVPGSSPTDSNRELTQWVRSDLVRKSRYLHKNSGFVRELVGNMALYSTGDGIRVQAQSGNPDWNLAAEQYFEMWSVSCEVTGRFSFEECQGLICRGVDVDGEYFVHKTRKDGEPRLQLLESHRISGDLADTGTTDGIKLDEYGAPTAYRVRLDDGTGSDIPAAAMLHVFEPEWASGVRSHPSIQHSINHVIDEIELLALEKHAVKDNSDVARTITTPRGELDENGDFVVTGEGGGTTADQSDPAALQKIVGGKLVVLKPGEKMEAYSSNRPNPTFTGFLEHIRRDSALGVLPYEFAADSSKVGGAGVRLVVAKADRRFSYRQMILERRLIRPVWMYVIGDAIARGLLPPVAGWWKIVTVPPRRITVDAGREAQQNRADVEMGLKTLTDHYTELGSTFAQELERRAMDAKLIVETAAKYGVPVEMLWKPTGGSASPIQPDEPPPGR
jgi:capsid protein